MMKRWAILAAASGFLLGCVASPVASEALMRANGWSVISADGQLVGTAMGAWVAFNDQDRSVAGNTGCNIMRGTFQRDGSSLSIPPLAVTKRACQPERMQAEDRVLKALSETTGWRIEADRLQLLDADGAVTLQAEPRQDGAM